MARLRARVIRDENRTPIGIETLIGRQRKGLVLKYLLTANGEIYELEVSGRKEDLPSLSEIIRIVESKEILRVRRIQEQATVTEYSVIHAEDDTLVNITNVAYEMAKQFIINADNKRIIKNVSVEARGTNPANSFLKITYNIDGGGETTLKEWSPLTADYEFYSETCELEGTTIVIKIYAKDTDVGHIVKVQECQVTGDYEREKFQYA